MRSVSSASLMMLTCACEAEADIAGESVVRQRGSGTRVLQPMHLVNDNAGPRKVIQ